MAVVVAQWPRLQPTFERFIHTWTAASSPDEDELPWYFERRLLVERGDLTRVSVEDLRRLMDAGESPIVVDVRTAGARARDPRRIPGALVITTEELDARVGELRPDREIILYCT